MSNTDIQTKECLEIQIGNNVSKSNDMYKLLSFEEVKDVVKRVLNSDIDLMEYAIQPYSDGKLGFLSSHYRLDVTAMRKKKTVALSFFLKTIPYEVPYQANYIIKTGVFEKEKDFYDIIMPLLLDGYCGKPWAPTCYKTKDNVMVFEELCIKGYSIRDKLFDETLVRAGLSAIARLHAASLLAEARLGAPFNQLYPEAFLERHFNCDGLPREWFKTGVDVTVAIAECLGYDSDLIRSVCGQIHIAMKPSHTKANVISHGDLWGNNLLFNKNVPPNCLLVDYQLLRYCSLAHDVAQFLYLCTDRSFRETREIAMLQHYYETLCETLNAHEIHIQKPPWSEIVEGMEEQRLSALITAILYFPTILMDENLSARIVNDEASYVQFYFRDRKQFTFSHMQKDPVFSRRINEAIIELAELASRLDQLPKPS